MKNYRHFPVKFWDNINMDFLVAISNYGHKKGIFLKGFEIRFRNFGNRIAMLKH